MSVTLTPPLSSGLPTVETDVDEVPWSSAAGRLLARVAAGRLDGDDVDGVLRHLSPRCLGEGQTVRPDGPDAPGLWLVVQGRLGVLRADDRARLVAVLLPGDLVCVDGAEEERVVALTPGLLAAFPPANRLAGPGGQARALGRLLTVLAGRARAQAQLRAQQQRGPLAARLARTLLDLADRCGTPGPEGLVVDHGLTQEQLGELIGVCRETVNKTLGDLGRDDALRVLPRAVVLRHPDALRARFPGPRHAVPPRRPQRIQDVNHIRSRHAETGRGSAVSTGSR